MKKWPANACNSVNFKDIFTFLGLKEPLARGEDIFLSANCKIVQFHQNQVVLGEKHFYKVLVVFIGGKLAFFGPF